MPFDGDMIHCYADNAINLDRPISMLRLAVYTAALALCLTTIPAHARDDTDKPGYVDFALHLGRTSTTVHYPQEEIESSVKRLGISAYEEINSHLQIALLAGYAYLSQPDQTLTAGLNLQGFLAGVGLRSTVVRKGPVAVTASSNYIYQYVEDEEANQSVSIEWHELELRLGATVNITSNLAMVVGASRGWIDGEQRAKGTLTQTTGIEAKMQAGAFAGLDLDVGGDGHIGFQLLRGMHDGFDIYFQRYF